MPANGYTQMNAGKHCRPVLQKSMPINGNTQPNAAPPPPPRQPPCAHTLSPAPETSNIDTSQRVPPGTAVISVGTGAPAGRVATSGEAGAVAGAQGGDTGGL